MGDAGAPVEFGCLPGRAELPPVALDLKVPEGAPVGVYYVVAVIVFGADIWIVRKPLRIESHGKDAS